MAAFGHSVSSPMTAEEALQLASASKPETVRHIQPMQTPEGLRPGMSVQVTPDDNARVPVKGQLVAADAFHVVIHRRDEIAGDLHIHFPRLGYTVQAV